MLDILKIKTGWKKVEVAVGVDDHLENIFVAICKPVKFGNYYSFYERIDRAVVCD
jgi:hypothetical protein